MKQSRLLALLFSVLVFAGIPLHASAVQHQSYVLAVLPASPPVATYSRWMPFVERISREAGVSLQLKVYERMAEFERDITAGVPDFIFANPFQAVVAHRLHGYRPLVRSSNPVSVGVFVLKESPVTSINELSNRKVAFVGNKNL